MVKLLLVGASDLLDTLHGLFKQRLHHFTAATLACYLKCQKLLMPTCIANILAFWTAGSLWQAADEAHLE